MIIYNFFTWQDTQKFLVYISAENEAEAQVIVNESYKENVERYTQVGYGVGDYEDFFDASVWANQRGYSEPMLLTDDDIIDGDAIDRLFMKAVMHPWYTRQEKIDRMIK